MRKLEQSLLASVLSRTAGEVFSTMLALEGTPGNSRLESKTPCDFEGVISFIGMAGEWVGTGCIECHPQAACLLASKFLMSEFDRVDDEVLDAVGELTNMIFGNFKNEMEPSTGAMGLSIPTVIHGRNFTARSLGESEWVVLPFSFDGHTIVIRICLRPNEAGTKMSRGSARHEFVLQP
jgi:chemotaxis protein CheX